MGGGFSASEAYNRHIEKLTLYAQTPDESAIQLGPAIMAAGCLMALLSEESLAHQKADVATEFVLVGLMRLVKTKRQDALKVAFPLLILLADGNPSVKDKLGSAGRIDYFYQLLQVDQEKVQALHPRFYMLVAQLAVQLLVVLAEDHLHNQELMIATQRLFDPFKTLLEAGSAETKEKAARLLRLLITGRPDLQGITRSRGLVLPLAALLREPNKNVRREAMCALGAIARGHTRNQFDMRTLHSILLDLLLKVYPAPAPAEQGCVLRVLLDLVYNNSIAKQKLRSTDKFARLLLLQNSTNKEVRLAANDLVSHLMLPDPEKSMDDLTFQVGRFGESKDAVDEFQPPVVGNSCVSIRNLLGTTSEGRLPPPSTEVEKKGPTLPMVGKPGGSTYNLSGAPDTSLQTMEAALSALGFRRNTRAIPRGPNTNSQASASTAFFSNPPPIIKRSKWCLAAEAH